LVRHLEDLYIDYLGQEFFFIRYIVLHRSDFMRFPGKT
jgi:hypothetical protein